MKSASQTGFVLPFTLAVIAIVAVIAAFVGARIYSAQQTVFRMQINNDIDKALFSAEAKAIFVILTAPPAPGGFIVSGRPINEDAYLIGDEPLDYDELEPAELWRSAGGQRRDRLGNVDVIVTLRDITGLISLVSTDDQILSIFLQSFNISESRADAMIAKLRDYTDPDHRRRFLGAERADYRLRNAPPPTNSPLRSLEELKNVQDWADSGLSDNTEFLSLTTTRRTSYRPFEPAMPAALRRRAPVEAYRPETEDIFAASADGRVHPSSRLRMQLIAIDRANQIGVERLIEVQRRFEAIDVPYQRVLVYERLLTDSELREVALDGVPPIFEPST